jgi:hypothetical protein
MGQWNNDFLGESRRGNSSAQSGGVKAGGSGTYTPDITANTSPTKGAIIVDRADWVRHGRNIRIQYYYKQTSTGAANGLGNYRFSLPPGIVGDVSSFAAGMASDNTSPIIVGNGVISTGGDITGSGAHALVGLNVDGRSFTIFTQGSGVLTFVGSASGELGTNNVLYSVNMEFPVVGWSEYGQE